MSALDNRKRPEVDPKLYTRFLAEREKFSYIDIVSLKRYREEELTLRAWSETRDISMDALNKGVSWSEGNFRFFAKIDHDDEDSAGDVGRLKNHAQVAHLGKNRVRPWADWATRHREMERLVGFEEPNAVDRRRTGHHKGHEYEYVILPNSYQDCFSGLWERGYDKATCDRMAREYWLRDYARFESYGSKWHWVGVLVKVSVDLMGDGKSVLKGETSTLCGIESNSEELFFLSTVFDCYKEALSDTIDLHQPVLDKLGITAP